ncbi:MULTISPECIES: MFS transporter [unclassified Duganella]|uniref:MFS transporter n=1 Tax=unclassified Duganella TaxID=2636909 RepID=UPI000881B25B|nr:MULTISPECIES: MFS transporter [unclassified Duganella]SDG71572.1 Transmembrane secretion effector [Duganella sp. OV458]SDJ97327.1 Transmembrane secretion effector [Duganella sp. OV510]
MSTQLAAAMRHYLVARFLGVMGNNIIAVALGWQMYELTSSGWYLGLVGLVQFVPALLLTVPAGLLVDSADRRVVFAISLALQGVASAMLAWGSHAGWAGPGAILLVCVLIGVARSLQLPAQQALIPALVPASGLPQALALNASVNKLAMISGPALGGFLYAGGAALVYGVCAVAFLLSAVMAMLIATPAVVRMRERVTLGAMFAGIGFIRKNPVILGAMSLDMFATLLGGGMPLLPMFAKDILHTGAWGLGLLRAAPAIGGLLMTALMTRWPLEHKIGQRMYGAVFAYGLISIAFAFCTNLLASLLVLALLGAADVVSTVLRHSVVQIETDDGLRGRVGAVHATSIAASNQLGQFRAGVAAEWLGPVGALLAGGVATLLIAAWWTRLFPDLLHRDRLFRPTIPVHIGAKQ